MVYLLPILYMTKADLGQRFSIHSFSAYTLKLHLTCHICWVSYILCEGNLHFWNQIYKCVNLAFYNKSQFLDVLERACLVDGSFKPPIFSMGINSVPTCMAYLYSWISQVTKIVLGERKWKPVVTVRKTTVVSRTPHTLISVDLQTYLQDKIFLFKVPLKLISCMGGSREIL